MANNLDLLTADLTNFVVAPLNAFGIGGFGFDSDGESLAHLSADITEHYTEDNRFIQDHIAIRPRKITLKGYVGEVVHSSAEANSTFSQQAVQKLTILTSFLPTLSAAATQIQQQYAKGSIFGTGDSLDISSLPLSSASNIYALVKNIMGAFGPEKKQQNAYLYFKALMTEGILMGVQTPWEFIPNMAIESVHALQGEVTASMTDFSVTLKEFRFAQTASVAYSTTLGGQNSQPATAPQATQDDLSPLANQAALNEYRSQNGLSTPPVDIQLQGAAALQAPDLVTIGNVPGVSLPTRSLPGLQGQANGVSSLIPPVNASDLAITSAPSLSSVFKYPMPPAP